MRIILYTCFSHPKGAICIKICFHGLTNEYFYGGSSQDRAKVLPARSEPEPNNGYIPISRKSKLRLLFFMA